MKTALVCFFASSLLIITSFAQPPDTLWTHTYGMGESYGVQDTPDGGFAVISSTVPQGGTSTDAFLIKTDASGDTLWTRYYGGNGEEYGYSVQQTTDRGFIITGHTWSFGAGECDVYLVRTDADGDTIWTRTFGGPERDIGFCVQQTTDSGFIVTGRTGQFNTHDACLIKTDADGNRLWSRTYGGADKDEGCSVRQTTDGGYIITGYTESFGAGLSDLYLIRTNPDGDTLWTRTYGGTGYDSGNSVLQTQDGGFIITGYTSAYLAGPSTVYLIKTGANGDSLWTRTYGSNQEQMGESIQQTLDGGYIISGWTGTTAPMNPIYITYLIKTDAVGDTLWTDTFDFGKGYCVQQTADGGFVVAGYRYDGWLGPYSIYLIRLEGYLNVNNEPSQSLEFTLYPSYPNPFNPTTILSFSLPSISHVNLMVYDITGRQVSSLINGWHNAGTHQVTFDGSNLSSGIYFYQLNAGNFSRTGKMVLLK